MPESFKLSREQAAAVRTFGTDLGVSAGAGSGKTTVLVERYLEAVRAHGSKPENILAVTFTDKAANVLKERLRRRCDEEGLEDLRRSLDGAWIGTIHSFCARFLKENPLECGVDPLFSLMGAGEQEMLMEKALDALFEEESENEAFVKLLADAGEDPVRSGLKSFYEKQRAYAGEKDLLRSVAPEPELAKAESDLLSAVQREMRSRETDLSGPEAKLAAACRAASEAFSGAAGWGRRARVLAALKTLDLRSPRTKERVRAIRGLSEVWAALEVQRLAVPMKNEWKRLLGRFAERYEREKRVLGTHDYEDLLVLTHRALSGASPSQKALRVRTRRQFDLIFVDEYQDTSLLQAKIFEWIKRKDNLFVVGDVRQSIYRFRHAHPEVFLEALKRSKPVSLAENRRTRPEILGFANRVFGDLFGPGYEALIAKREFKLKKDHCLELIAVPRGTGTLDAHRVIEARTIASRIRAMVDAGFQVEEGGKARPARWKDFAVLLRRTTVSRLYEKELENSGIPYYANKGRGFYEKIEVSDLVNLLRVLENPSENIAMASVLRSPLAQLSDDALYWLSEKRSSSKTESDLCEILKRHRDVPEISEKDRSSIEVFLPLFQNWSALKDRLSLSELLHRIVDETAYEAKALTRPDGAQARANIWKLIEMASALEDKSVRGISDFILYLKSVSESSETEAEARIVGEEEDVVRILTVHAAKGLEFPILILADLGGEEGKGAKSIFNCSTAHGLGARLRDPESLDLCEDATYEAVQSEEKQKEAEESDRLLYVAMTRAQEHLILSGVAAKETKSGESGSRLSELERALEGTAFYRVPAISLRPAAVTLEAPLVESLSEGEDVALARGIEAQLEPISKPYESLEDLSVTRLMRSIETTRPFFEEPEEDPETVESGEGELSTPRNEYGTVFHLLMELGARRSPRGPLPAEQVETLTASLTSEEKKEISASMESFWKSPTGILVQKSPRCYPELPFIYKTRHGLLKGQLDLVFRSPRGWVILDYKTNRLQSGEVREQAVREYEPQLGLYALAFWKLYGQIPERTLLYFTSGSATAEVVWKKQDLEQLAARLDEQYRKALDARMGSLRK